MILMRTNNTTPTMMDTSLVYTNTYTIQLLSTDDDGREYECEVVINAITVVKASGRITLNVTGELLRDHYICKHRIKHVYSLY